MVYWHWYTGIATYPILCIFYSFFYSLLLSLFKSLFSILRFNSIIFKPVLTICVPCIQSYRSRCPVDEDQQSYINTVFHLFYSFSLFFILPFLLFILSFLVFRFLYFVLFPFPSTFLVSPFPVQRIPSTVAFPHLDFSRLHLSTSPLDALLYTLHHLYLHIYSIHLHSVHIQIHIHIQ